MHYFLKKYSFLIFTLAVIVLNIFALIIQAKSFLFNYSLEVLDIWPKFLTELIIGFSLYFLAQRYHSIKIERLKYFWLGLPVLYFLIVVYLGYDRTFYGNSIIGYIDFSWWALVFFALSLYYFVDIETENTKQRIMILSIMILNTVVLSLYFHNTSSYLELIVMYIILAYTFLPKSKLLSLLVLIAGITVTFLSYQEYHDTKQKLADNYMKNDPHGGSYQVIKNLEILRSSKLISFGENNPQDIYKNRLPQSTSHSTLSVIFYHYGKVGALISLLLLFSVLIFAWKYLKNMPQSQSKYFAKLIIIILFLYSSIHVLNVMGLVFIHSLLPFYSASTDIYITGMLVLGLSSRRFNE